MNQHTDKPSTVVPRLVCRDAAAAIAFYCKALDATETERFATPDGMIVHAALNVGGNCFTLAEENPRFCNQAPSTLGGSPVLLTLEVADADAVGARMVAAGAEVVIEIDDRFYGKREGRLRDPFGHLWIISQHLEDLSPEEINRRLSGSA